MGAGDELPVDLHDVEDEVLEVVERAVAGPEVVEREARAEGLQPLPERPRGGDVRHSRRLGHLEDERARVDRVLLQRLPQGTLDVRVPDGAGRDVHLEAEVGVEPAERGEHRHGPAQDPGVERGRQAGELGDVDERPRRDELVPLAHPHEGLGSGHPVVGQVEDGLQVDDEPVLLERPFDPVPPLHPGAEPRVPVVLLGEQDVAVAPGVLGVVHEHVREDDGVALVARGGGERHDADRRRHPLVGPADAGAVGTDLLHEPRRDRLGPRAVRLGQQDGELVATEPGDDVGLPDPARQDRADRRDELVTGGVPERVVDLLEVVEVDEQQGAAG